MSVLRFDATMSSPERLKVMADFNSDEKAKVILVTTRRGGVGLSFTFAGRVIHLTQSWDPAMMWQANHRVCRHPRKLQVYIDHPYAFDSIERKVVGVQEKKKTKSSALLDPDEAMMIHIILGTRKFSKSCKRVPMRFCCMANR
jgi:SNF2 family DNA or RNA helicase